MTFFRELPSNEICPTKPMYGGLKSGGSHQLSFVCSFKTLAMLFGSPREGFQYNSRFLWYVKDMDSPACVDIYEWISKGVPLEKYPTPEQVMDSPIYRWNVGAHTLEDAELFLEWLMSRDPSVRRVEGIADMLREFKAAECQRD